MSQLNAFPFLLLSFRAILSDDDFLGFCIKKGEGGALSADARQIR
jgi:hypothetical protein